LSEKFWKELCEAFDQKQRDDELRKLDRTEKQSRLVIMFDRALDEQNNLESVEPADPDIYNTSNAGN
jgi:RNA binding exosome subunit